MHGGCWAGACWASAGWRDPCCFLGELKMPEQRLSYVQFKCVAGYTYMLLPIALQTETDLLCLDSLLPRLRCCQLWMVHPRTWYDVKNTHEAVFVWGHILKMGLPRCERSRLYSEGAQRWRYVFTFVHTGLHRFSLNCTTWVHLVNWWLLWKQVIIEQYLFYNVLAGYLGIFEQCWNALWHIFPVQNM